MARYLESIDRRRRLILGRLDRRGRSPLQSQGRKGRASLLDWGRPDSLILADDGGGLSDHTTLRRETFFGCSVPWGILVVMPVWESNEDSDGVDVDPMY